MTFYKNLKGKRIPEVSGFICTYAYDPDYPWYDDHVFLKFDLLPENGLLDKEFELEYGDLFVKKYTKHIDFKPYSVYVFKRDPDVINAVLALGGIEYKLPLEDDDSLYLPDDYSFTVDKMKKALCH